MKIEFNDQQLQYVVNVLADQPFKLVVELMQSIQQQVNAGQQQAKEPATKEPLSVVPNTTPPAEPKK